MLMDVSKWPTDCRPRLLLVYADSVHAAQSSRYFRRHGWDVHVATNGEEAFRKVGALAPAAVVLDSDLPTEGAWQTCAKITHGNPGAKVVILAGQDNSASERAQQVGAAALVSRSANLDTLADQLLSASGVG